MTNKEFAENLRSNFKVNAPAYRGAAMPPYKTNAVNESEFADELRFKEVSVEADIVDDSRVYVTIVWISQGWTEVTKSFFDEIERYVNYRAALDELEGKVEVSVRLASRDNRADETAHYSFTVGSDEPVDNLTEATANDSTNMSNQTGTKYFVSVYQKDAVYEPAEGGSYVEVTTLQATTPASSFAEAVDIAADTAEADRFGDTIGEEQRRSTAEDAEHRFLTDGSVLIFSTYGRHIGEGIDIYIESPERKGSNENKYYGYQ